MGRERTRGENDVRVSNNSLLSIRKLTTAFTLLSN